MLNYPQVTLTLVELTSFPSVNIPMLATVFYLTGPSLLLEVVVGNFTDINKNTFQILLENADLEVLKNNHLSLK